MEFYEKITAIQGRLKAPKSQFNKFGNYSYRSCEDILESVKPLLTEYGLFINISDTVEAVGTRFYIKATATISDGKSSVSSVAYAREEESKKGMDGSQITGSASSYARKYALNGLLAIDDTKDSDSTNTGATSKKAEPAEQVKPKEYKWAEQAKPTEYKCECCGKPFEEFDWRGRHYTAGQAYEMSKKKYQGKALCKKCGEQEGATA